MKKMISVLVLAGAALLAGCEAAKVSQHKQSGSITNRQPDVVVALDGGGKYKSVQEAIMAAPHTATPSNPWVILVKPGIYKELVYVQRERGCIKLVGEDAEKTIITQGLHAKMIGLDGKEIGTFRTPTMVVDGDHFQAENLTFENSAGPVGQALAMRVDGDRVAFRNCRFLGWQDTLFVNRGRHYFTNCYIAGHVDFIFGGATCYFDRCHIHALKDGYLTAASTPKTEKYGFVFEHCKITGEAGVKTYLGRPWRGYAATAFLNCDMSEAVRPEGWHNWGKAEGEATVRYAEYLNFGEGGQTNNRVNWVRPLNTAGTNEYSINSVLGGRDGWRPDAPAK